MDKVTPGQRLKFPADTWNNVLDATAAYQATQLAKPTPGFRGNAVDPDLVLCLNASAELFARDDVVELGDAVIEPATNEISWRAGHSAFKADTPSTEEIHGRIAILIEPAAAGKFARAVASGVVRTRIDRQHADHRYAYAEAGSRRLKTTDQSGAPIEILYSESDAIGETFATVRISNSDGPELIPFELIERAESLDDWPKEAYALDPDGSQTSILIDIESDPIVPGIYGPADIGFRGWAKLKEVGSSGSNDVYTIVHMQRFAEYIRFTGADFTGGCQIPGTVGSYWHGENPSVWPNVYLDATHFDSCSCLGSDADGLAVLDEKLSAYPTLIYRVVEVDQMLLMVDAGDCNPNPCLTGSPTRTLIVADGLSLLTADCSGTVPCPKVLSADGLTVESVSCESSPGSPGDDDISEGGVRTLTFRSPLTATVSTACPASAEVGLADDLISSSCLEVSRDGCNYTIDLPSGLVTAGTCVVVTESACSYEVSVHPACLINDIHIIAGPCISIADDGNGHVTVTNTMQLTAGNGVTIGGTACNPIISADGFDAGNCIWIDNTGPLPVINSSVKVTGGNGIVVTKNDCNYLVSLAGEHGDPTTSIRFVCDIECVESSGTYNLVVKYGTLELPAAIISGYTSECDGGSGGDPLYTCDTCQDCGTGELELYPLKIVKDDGSACDCIGASDPIPDGWTACGGGDVDVGGSLSSNGIECESYPPHFSYTVNEIPSGAIRLIIAVTGDKGSSATVGEDANHVAGQLYWGALVDSWEDPVAGESFTFSAQWRDAAGDPLGDPITWADTCS